MTDLLDVHDLRVEFQTSEGVGSALNGVDISVKEGQVLGIVGESGSGKSVVAMALVNLVARPGRIVSGSVKYRGTRPAPRERTSTAENSGTRDRTGRPECEIRAEPVGHDWTSTRQRHSRSWNT